MTISAEKIVQQLESIANDEFFSASADVFIREWVADGATADIVDPILRFFEAHPNVDHGTPGSLVHYVESFSGLGYEQHLLASLERKPTPPTVWMLNRCINGAPSASERERLRRLLALARNHPLTDDPTRETIDDFERYQALRD